MGTLVERVKMAGFKISVELDRDQQKRLYETGRLPVLPEWLGGSSFAVPNFKTTELSDVTLQELQEVADIAPGNRRLAYQLAVAKKLAQLDKSAGIVYSVLCNLPSLSSVESLLEKLKGISDGLTVLAVLGDLREGEKPTYSVYDLIGKVKGKGFVPASGMSLERPNEFDNVRKKVKRGAAVFYTQPIFAENAANLAEILRQTRDLEYEVRVGLVIPFSEAVSKIVSAGAPGFLPTGDEFYNKLRDAEGKGEKPYVEMAKEGLRAALALAESDSRIKGLHLYAVTSRKYGEVTLPARVLMSNLFEYRQKAQL